MERSSGLAILALLIAIGALGIGVYQVIAPAAPPEGSGIRNTWYKFDYASRYTNPTTTLIIIDQLTIDFTVSSGESVYCLFNTWATVDTGGFIQFNFILDGVYLSGPTHPWWVLRATGSSIEAPVSLQISLDTVLAGAHNMTISIYGNDVDNEIFSSTLLVQTYIP